MNSQEISSSRALIQEGTSVLVYLTVSPDAKKNGITKMNAKSIHIALKAPPKQGMANRALIAFFSEILALPIESFILKKGHTSHKKVLLIKNCSLPDILQKISTFF